MYTQIIPKNLEQTASLKIYKSEHLAKENIQILNKHIKNTQKSYIIRKLQIKTTHLLELVNSKNKNKKKQPRGFPGSSVVKPPPDNARDSNMIPYLGRYHVPRSNLAVFFPKAKQSSTEDQTLHI